MTAFGATPPSPDYVGGGDLWEEPTPPPPREPSMLLGVLIVLGIVAAVLTASGASFFIGQ